MSQQEASEGHERPLTSTERNFVEKELEGAWSQWRDNGERLDVLIITPDERIGLMWLKYFPCHEFVSWPKKLA